MLECKDCVCYDTEACRYGRYAIEHNMSLQCEDFIVEHNNAYQQGRADAINAIKNDLHKRLTEEMNKPYQDQGLCQGLYFGIQRCDWYLDDGKEQKLCSNGKTCTHPNCKRCGTTHFMSECDYGKEQNNEQSV